MVDELSAQHADLLTGSYDCVDRVVANAYCSMCHSPGGFRNWWRRLMNGSDEELDNAHLMRLAGRFARRLRAFAKATGIPIIDCGRGERKHELAAEYLASHPLLSGLFMILVARAAAKVWEVQRSPKGIHHIASKQSYINHYSFHVLDPDWGHVTFKMAGHPPFDVQVILNGHEYVAAQAKGLGASFVKEGNCFTQITDVAALASVADTLSEPETAGRLRQLCERWLYSTCLCFALDTEEQMRSGFAYDFSVYQMEYSRNLLFRQGGQMEEIFQRLVDRTRSRLDVPRLRTLFGVKARPHRDRKLSSRQEVVLERPSYDLTVLKLHFGSLSLKAYSKGEHVLRFEAIVHNAGYLKCGRVLERFPLIVAHLKGMLERFLTTLDCVDTTFVSDQFLDQLPLPTQMGATRVGGIDLNKQRVRGAMAAVLALAPSPRGFSIGQLAAKARGITGQSQAQYTDRQAAYDLKKLRSKELVRMVPHSRRYEVPALAVRTMAGLLLIREQVIKPVLAGQRRSGQGAKPSTLTLVDQHYERLRSDMQILFKDLGLAA